MSKKNKKILLVLTLLFFCPFLCACPKDSIPKGTEIEQFDVFRIFGVDQSADDPTLVEATFLVENILQQSGGSKDGGGGGAKVYTIKSSTASTIFEAQRTLKAHSDKKEFFGYVDFILIGEAAAKEDIGKYFDFIVRGHEFRLSPKVFIIQGSSVKDFIEQASSESVYIADRLENLEFDISDLSNTQEVRTIDVFSMLNNDQIATVIPVLKLKDFEDEVLIGGQQPQKDIETHGYAVIKDFKLVGYFDETLARGHNFLFNEVHSAPISVKDYTGEYVALEVLHQTLKVQAHFKGDTLEGVTYVSEVFSNITEQHSKADIYSRYSLEQLAAEQSKVLQTEMEQMIQKSQEEFGIDCIHLAERIRMSHPLKWQKIKDSWKEIFPTLKIEVQVQSDIRRSYDIHEPAGYDTGDKQKWSIYH